MTHTESMFSYDIHKIREVVAVKIGTRITTDPLEILRAIRSNVDVQLFDRGVAEMMAACDLGEKWESLAKAESIFTFDAKTNKVIDCIYGERFKKHYNAQVDAAEDI